MAPFNTATIQLPPEDIELPPSPDPSEEVFSSQPKQAIASLSVMQEHTPTMRRVTSPEAIPTSELSAQLPNTPQSRSPLPRGHLRSHSSSPILTAPPMTRAHSSPTPDSVGRPLVTLKQVRPASPLHTQSRRRSPLRSSIEDTYFAAPTWNGISIEPEIPEHAELDTSITNRTVYSDYDFIRASSPIHNTFPRIRRRPSSPLSQSSSVQNAFAQSSTISPAPRTSQSSPILNTRYMSEAYPSYSVGSASSMPSTPTSFRSRSPSISSLETIPDSPDAEYAAQLEVEELMRMKSASSEGDDDVIKEDGTGLRRKGTFEIRGYGFSKDKRKRWSVCGAEKRGDLEVIWED